MDLLTTLEAVATRVRDAHHPNPVDVSTDATRLRLPGLLVRLVDVEVDTYAGHAVRAEAIAVAPDRDDPRALSILSRLVGPVLHADDLEITGPATLRPVQLPNQPHPMPGLVVPVRVHESE